MPSSIPTDAALAQADRLRQEADDANDSGSKKSAETLRASADRVIDSNRKP